MYQKTREYNAKLPSDEVAQTDRISFNGLDVDRTIAKNALETCVILKVCTYGMQFCNNFCMLLLVKNVKKPLWFPLKIALPIARNRIVASRTSLAKKRDVHKHTMKLQVFGPFQHGM